MVFNRWEGRKMSKKGTNWQKFVLKPPFWHYNFSLKSSNYFFRNSATCYIQQREQPFSPPIPNGLEDCSDQATCEFAKASCRSCCCISFRRSTNNLQMKLLEFRFFFFFGGMCHILLEDLPPLTRIFMSTSSTFNTGGCGCQCKEYFLTHFSEFVTCSTGGLD